MYKEVWEASCGEMLSCARETGNTIDPFSVCVKNMGVQWATCQGTFLQLFFVLAAWRDYSMYGYW